MSRVGRSLPDRREFLALGVGALAVAAVPGVLRRERRLIRRRIPVMGTIAEVAVRHENEVWAQRAINAAFEELRRVDRTMTRFRSDSDVGRVNEARGGVVAVSEDTAIVLTSGLVWAGASAGRFDPCMGRFAEAHEQGAAPPARPPRGSLAGALEVDRSGSTTRVRIHDPMAAVDLGGIAKGYAVDLAARALRDQGIFHALVNAGGDLIAMGVDEDGDPWKIGIRSPDHPERVAEVIRVSDRAVATSGTYFRGRHILDPATGGEMSTGMRSLTVEAVTCMDADAGATAVFGLSRSKADGILRAAAGDARVIHSL
ncbi:MAG: FAD:protein FMN transferase [Gemmatimonadota bacterium]